MILESSDGGRTVYARVPGSTQRTIIKQDVNWERQKVRATKWAHILIEAENNPALDDAVKKAELIYELVKKECNDNS